MTVAYGNSTLGAACSVAVSAANAVRAKINENERIDVTSGRDSVAGWADLESGEKSFADGGVITEWPNWLKRS